MIALLLAAMTQPSFAGVTMTVDERDPLPVPVTISRSETALESGGAVVAELPDLHELFEKATTTRNVALLSLAVPTSFSRLQRMGEERWELVPELSVGVGASLLVGKMTLAPGRDGEMDTWLYVGGAVNVSQVGGDAGGLSFSAFAGFKNVGVLVGWDVTAEQPFVGVGAAVSLAQLGKDNFFCFKGCD